MSKLETQYIDTHSSAEQFSSTYSGSEIIAVDTEFERSRTFYAKPGLIQFAVKGQVALIDPIAVPIESYGAMLLDKTSLKLIHACGEDLELLHRLCGEVPEPLFDTQLAATYAGFRPQIGYQALVKDILDIDIAKHQTRSDWLRRPLSADQLEYAALDVLYLEEIYQELKSRLEKTERLDWVKEDCNRLAFNERKTIAADIYYRQVGNAWKLNPQKLVILKAITEWREMEIRRIDTPRSFLVSDTLLWEVACHQPRTTAQLSKIQGFKPGIMRQYGDLILDLVNQSDEVEKESWPTLVSQPILRAVPSLAKKLKAEIRRCAEKMDLPPEILCRKKLLVSLMDSYVQSSGSGDAIQLAPEFSGWRSQFILKPLLEILDAHQGELKSLSISNQ
ncbi:MAG: ribonuclease D [Pseudomonadales bacterium]|nr:ribonuclease D [Pseudomonadales bacterium]